MWFMCVEIKKRGEKKGLDDGFVLADLYLAEIRIGSFIKKKKLGYSHKKPPNTITFMSLDCGRKVEHRKKPTQGTGQHANSTQKPQVISTFKLRTFWSPDSC